MTVAYLHKAQAVQWLTRTRIRYWYMARKACVLRRYTGGPVLQAQRIRLEPSLMVCVHVRCRGSPHSGGHKCSSLPLWPQRTSGHSV